MSYQGRVSAAEMVKCFPSVRRRASAWLAAQARDEDPARDLATDVVVHDHKRAFVNFFAMEEMDLQFRRYDGTMSPVMNRCAALVGRAAVVLPYDPLRDQVLLVEQFRAATYIAGEKRPWMWEPVAGLIDPGETPETGRAPRSHGRGRGKTDGPGTRSAMPILPAGLRANIFTFLLGLADLSDIQTTAVALPAKAKTCAAKSSVLRRFMQGIDDHSYQDLPLITSALWLARHRDRLRASAR